MRKKMNTSNTGKNRDTENGGCKKMAASREDAWLIDHNHDHNMEEEHSFDSKCRPPQFNCHSSSNIHLVWDYSGPSTWDQTSSSGGVQTDQTLSPMSKSPWSTHIAPSEATGGEQQNYDYTGLMGSLVRQEGHIYSLAASGDLLYTGSDSKNIRVWKNHKEFAGFKSNSGLVKAIIISEDKIFTGHQDGKVRVWKISSKNPSVHRRVGSLPTLKACFKSSLKTCSYIELKKNRNLACMKHADAISCMSISEDKNFLYSASWDKTIKVWRVSNFKYLESIEAHDDSVNAVVSGFDGLVFSGSADGSVKSWRIELEGKGTKHHFSQTLLKQECAVTALAVEFSAAVLYCGTSDGNINFWEREDQLAHGGVLRGHKLAVLSIATARDLVFSASADTNICVWRKEGNHHICLSILAGHSGPVKCLAVEKDYGSISKQEKENGEHWIVYSGSLDKSVKIWKVKSTPQIQPECRTETYPSLHSFSSRGSRVSQMRPL